MQGENTGSIYTEVLTAVLLGWVILFCSLLYMSVFSKFSAQDVHPFYHFTGARQCRGQG